MILDRLQTAWLYTTAEIWRPLFDRYQAAHPDLPIAVMRTMLVRPRGMRQIFVETGYSPALDPLREDRPIVGHGERPRVRRSRGRERRQTGHRIHRGIRQQGHLRRVVQHC